MLITRRIALVMAIILVVGMIVLRPVKHSSAALNVSNELVSFEHTNAGPTSGIAQASFISDDGNRVVFYSSANDIVTNDQVPSLTEPFFRDMKSEKNYKISLEDNGDQDPYGGHAIAFSENGRYILFSTPSKSILDGSSGSGYSHIFLRDTYDNTTELISQSTNGDPANQNSDISFGGVSNDGRFAVFVSTATNLVVPANGYGYQQVYLRDRLNGSTTVLSKDNDGNNPSNYVTYKSKSGMSCSGSFVVFSGKADGLPDANLYSDIYLVDIRNGFKIKNITSGADSHNTEPYISCNGNYIVFKSSATNLVNGQSYSGTHLYAYDRLADQTYLVDQSDDGTAANHYYNNLPMGRIVSDNGKVVFASGANNLVSTPITHTQIFMRDLRSQTTHLISVDSTGLPGNGIAPTISKNGKQIAYITNAHNLISQTFSYNQVIRATLQY